MYTAYNLYARKTGSTHPDEYLVVYQSGDGELALGGQNHIYGQRITWDGGRSGGARQLSELTDWHVHPDIAARTGVGPGEAAG